jgi:hypothetical protein
MVADRRPFPDETRPGAWQPPVKIAADTPCPPAMPLFWKPYTSDVTSFIEKLKADKPTLEAEQRAGRALLWDKRIDRDAMGEWREASVPQQPYVYQTKTQ